jgi:hypothetical protein
MVQRALELPRAVSLAWAVWAGLALVGALWLARTRRAGLIAATVPLLLAAFAYSFLAADWMTEYRFATPVFPALALVTALAAAALMEAASAQIQPRLACLIPAVAAVLAANLFIGSAQPMADRLAGFKASPTVPACWVADRYGRLFNFYADSFGVASGSLLLPDIGGTLLTSRLDLVDVAGLTSAEIARLRQAGDWDGLGDYVFDVVKPTFIHVHDAWALGVAGDPRLERDYLSLKTAGDYVRQDAVPADADWDGILAAGAAYAGRAGAAGDCGPLAVGQWPT